MILIHTFADHSAPTYRYSLPMPASTFTERRIDTTDPRGARLAPIPPPVIFEGVSPTWIRMQTAPVRRIDQEHAETTRDNTVVVKAIKRKWLTSALQGGDPVVLAATRADVDVTDAVYKLVCAGRAPTRYGPDMFRDIKKAVIRARTEGQPLQIHEDTKRIDTLVGEILGRVRGGRQRAVPAKKSDTERKVSKVTKKKARRSPAVRKAVLPKASTVNRVKVAGMPGSSPDGASSGTTLVVSRKNSAGSTPSGSPSDTVQRKSGRERTEKKWFGE